MSDDDEASDAPDEVSAARRTHALRADRDTTVQAFTVLVLSGPDAGQRFASTGATMSLGTHRRCAATLSDPTVSRFHCELELAAGRARVRDLGSRNGTVLDGVAIADGWLRSGSVLTLGRTTVRFDVGVDTVALPASERDGFGLLLGRSLKMRRVFDVLRRAAGSDATVLLLGETGTGKEAVAESLHRESKRASGPFVVVDCGAIPPSLLEGEFFGHERGAFTGASQAREGVLEAASGGTVFLDEIGELGADLQPKLLRALERREVRRLGTNHYVPIDVRIVAATHRDLRAEVNAKRFRSDLYYRLAVVEVHLPPLRERPEDVPLLVQHFLKTLAPADSPASSFLRSQAFLDGLAEHAWPSNVRELRNYVERTLALYGLPDAPGDDADAASAGVPLKDAREAALRRFERRYLERVLEQHEGNVTAAARAAGVDRVHFYRLLWRHGLK